MCRIMGGIVNPNTPFDLEVLESMRHMLKHGGPDDYGVEIFNIHQDNSQAKNIGIAFLSLIHIYCSRPSSLPFRSATTRTMRGIINPCSMSSSAFSASTWTWKYALPADVWMWCCAPIAPSTS